MLSVWLWFAAAAVALTHAQIGSQPAGTLLNAHATASNPSTHKLYAVESATNTVAIFNTRSGLRREIAVGKEPIAVAIDPTSGTAYVVNAGDATVSVLIDDSVAATVHVTHPYDIAIDPQTGAALITNTFSANLDVIDATTHAVHSIKAGSADAIVTDPHSGSVYLLGYEASAVRVLRGGKITSQPAPMHLWGAATGGDGTLWVTALGDAEAIAIDEPSGERAVIPAGTLPCAIAVNSKTSKVYVANCGDDTLTTIDAHTRKNISTTPTGQHPQAVAIDETTGSVFVANTLGNSITVLGNQRTRIPCAPHPYSLAALDGRVIVAHVNAPATIIDTRK